MFLAKKLKDNKPKCDVWLTFVVSEETSGSGTKNFLTWFKKNYIKQYKDIAGVLLEPTGLESIEVGHRGNIFIKLKTLGDSGHGSQPQKIQNHAVFIMIKVLEKIQKLEKSWKKKYKHEFLGEPSIGIATSIQAGSVESPNKFPDSCVTTLDIRTTPKLNSVVLQELKESLK